MNHNNNNVDVLAWLRANLRSAEGRDVVIPAVAELIEATKHLRDCGGDEGSDPGSTADMRLDAAKDRVDAALARVGGGK